MRFSQTLKNELFGGWRPFEVVWLFLFIAAQLYAYVQSPVSWLEALAGISGILCVVFVGKGKISNYFFGLIFAYSYFYVSLDNKFYGEMTTTLYVYIPAQFIGYFLWKENMRNSTEQSETVIAKFLTLKGWVTLISLVALGSIAFISILKTTDGNSIGLDGVTTVFVIAAQLLMILRYSEQWILWIIINILSIILWADTPAMYLMYGAYLLNSLYGYYNWSKLAKNS
ncbi:nicotinamide riboside transporter PnuC [Avibacterium sp. 21-586]|uniref:nicotinamide riboside transporter PnuC n=1 Tax=Avibacterium sp. 21-586 TaxID=2911534 RepID=UPI002246DD94|nr:nicotinamide riboside transporter PnuC [Avibacterium sp. 21-586]MCW9711244.1 nicotinamide riboside transporter PnuC [Avibacterium sp. 21-586]